GAGIDAVDELDGHDVTALAGERGDILDRNQPSLAEYARPVTDPRHLCEVVRGEKDGATTVLCFANQLVHRPLRQRVERRAGLERARSVPRAAAAVPYRYGGPAAAKAPGPWSRLACAPPSPAT